MTKRKRALTVLSAAACALGVDRLAVIRSAPSDRGRPESRRSCRYLSDADDRCATVGSFDAAGQCQ